MLYRSHRGSLEASMKTVCEVESIGDIWKIEKLFTFGIDRKIRIKFYSYDIRIGWDTYIITCDDYGVLGFSNGMIPQTKEANNE